MIAAGLAHQGLVSARGARGAEIGANSRDAAGGPVLHEAVVCPARDGRRRKSSNAKRQCHSFLTPFLAPFLAHLFSPGFLAVVVVPLRGTQRAMPSQNCVGREDRRQLFEQAAAERPAGDDKQQQVPRLEEKAHGCAALSTFYVSAPAFRFQQGALICLTLLRWATLGWPPG
jgi:hypothetical protein